MLSESWNSLVKTGVISSEAVLSTKAGIDSWACCLAGFGINSKGLNP